MSLHQDDDDDDDDETFSAKSDEPEVPSDTVIRRHAALHQLPLHVLEQQQLQHQQHAVPASREYGYGYIIFRGKTFNLPFQNRSWVALIQI